MFSKPFLVIISTLFALPLLAPAQVKPGPSGIVCFIDANETPAALASDPAWKESDIQGVLVRQSWAALEPTEGAYDFSMLDRALQLAHQNGKFIGLSIGAGTLSPAWLYPAGARAASFQNTAGVSQNMPLPWDPIFQSAWSSTIEALGNRYDTDSTVAYVTASGAGRDYGSSLVSTADDVPKFDALGGSVFWTHAANDIADIYATSFPHTETMLPMDPAIPGALGKKMVESVASGQMDANAGQFGMIAATLVSDPTGEVSSMLSSNSESQPPVGLELDSSANLREALTLARQNGLLRRSVFLVLNSRQVTQPDARSPLEQVARQLALNAGGKSTAGPSQTTSTAASSGNTSSTSAPPSTGSTAGGATNSTPSSGTDTASAKSTSSTSSTSSSTPPAMSTAAETAICVQIAAAARTAAYTGQPIWLGTAPNNSIGTGTESDPLNVPTADRLESALFFFSTNEWPNLVFHFLPGTFYTDGNIHQWVVSTGWQFLGSGESSTILKIDNSATTYTGTNKFADNKAVISTNGQGGILVQDMTVDANATGFGSQLAASFKMPAPRAKVTVEVTDSSAFTVGKWVYLQDSVPTGGLNLYYGLMTVVAIPSATEVTLQNCEVAAAGTITGTLTSGSPVIQGVSSITNLEEGQALTGAGIPAGATILSAASGVVTLSANATATGEEVFTYSPVCVYGQFSWFCPPGNVPPQTTIPATAHVLVAVCTAGIGAGRSGDTIKNITVQDVGRPFYEGPVGICFNGFGTCAGGSVENCTVQDIWGTSSWIINLTQTNGVSLIGNTILGNGYSQAFSSCGDNSNVTISNNNAVNVANGFFSDTGTKTNFTVTNNSFQSLNGIALMGAVFTQSNFSHNTLLIDRSYGFGIALAGATLTDMTFSANKIEVAPGVANPQGISFGANCTDSSGNIFSDNVVSSAARNTCGNAAFGTQSGNVDQNDDPISLGLNE